MRSHARTRRNGFTLIELLVVISIVSLLISILLPSLHKARESSRNIQCQARLRPMMLGFIGWSDANSGHMPRQGWWDVRTVSGVKRFGVPYYVDSNNTLPGRRMLRCPDIDWQYNKASRVKFGSSWFYEYTTYAYNDFWFSPTGSHFTSVDQFKLDNARTPSYALVLGDGSNTVIYGNSKDLGDWRSPRHGQPTALPTNTTSGVRKANGLFADGHVELMTSPVSRFSWQTTAGTMGTVEMMLYNLRGQ